MAVRKGYALHAWPPALSLAQPAAWDASGTACYGTVDWLEAYGVESELQRLEPPARASSGPLEGLIDLMADAVVERIASRHAPPAPELLPLRATGQSVRTLRAAIAAGELAAVKVGRELQVRREDLDRWIASRAVAPRQAKPRELSPAERAIEDARRRGALRVVGSH
jgi:excisionase family DNA binding protein